MKNKTILKENMKRFGTKNLKEGYAWERKADGTLPTLKDATKQHESNISEQDIIGKSDIGSVNIQPDQPQDSFLWFATAELPQLGTMKGTWESNGKTLTMNIDGQTTSYDITTRDFSKAIASLR